MASITTILADDDYLVLQDLETLVDWEALGFHIAGTASNGKSALDLVRRFRPALVITDISMPVMDGFDLIETLRKDHPDTYVMLISSYADFDYAKRAISDGIQDYILKNEITPDLMNEKLSAVKARIESSNKRRQQDLHRELRVFLENDGELPESIPAGRPFLFSVFSLHLPLEKLKDHFDHLDHFGERLYSAAQETLSRQNPSPILFTSGPFLIAGIAAGDLKGSLSVTAMSRTFKNQKSALLAKEPHIIGSFCRESITFPEFRKLFRKVLPKLNYLSSFPSDAPVTLDQLSETAFVPYGKIFAYEILASSRENSTDFAVRLSAFLDGLSAHQDADGIFMLYHNLLLQIEELSGHLLPDPSPRYFEKPEELCHFFCSLLEQCRELSGPAAPEDLSPAVRLAREYIENHYSDPSLGINQIAEAAFLSASRLRVLYKKETGQTVNDFLINTRISRAVYLLENTNLRIYEIAGQAGYRSAQYFSQILQQKTGRKPLDFRRKKP